MKNASAVLAAILFLSFAAPALSAMRHEPTIDKGKLLFNDPKLGSNGKTCNDCHKDGTGMEKAADRKDLEGMVNGCIKANLKGKALKPKSVEMQSLLLYIRSVGSAKKPATKSTTSVGC
jgi:cytochrome c peroxidase